MNEFDIRKEARSTVSEALKEIKEKFKNVKFIMVLDDAVDQILTSLFSMSELMEYNIVLIERYSLKRKPLTAYHAIYFFGPDVDVTHFINDWEKEPKYAAPHVLFTFAASSECLQKLQSKPSVVDHILTFKFLYMHFIPMDPFTFITPSLNCFNSMYAPGPSIPMEKINSEIMQGLVSFFFTIKCKPAVAYNKKFKPCETFAEQFSTVMNATFDSLPNDLQQKFHQTDTLLLIIGRGDDPVAPLLHQFTFEAMLYEYYNVKNHELKMDSQNSKAKANQDAEPDENTNIMSLDYYYENTFRELRYVHCENLIDHAKCIAAKYIELQKQKSSPDRKLQQEATRKITNERKTYNQVISEYSIILEIMEKKITTAITEVSEYEQKMASGMENQDDKFKPSKVVLSQFLSRNDLSELDKIRLFAMYGMIVKKVTPKDIQNTFKSAGIDIQKYRDMVLNSSLVVTDIDRKSKYDKDGYTTSKYIPYVSELVKGAIDKKLPKKNMEIPELPSTLQNLVVFVMGGISYMELREINEIRDKVRGMKIFVGSTNTLTPKLYLEQIGKLKNNPLQ